MKTTLFFSYSNVVGGGFLTTKGKKGMYFIVSNSWWCLGHHSRQHHKYGMEDKDDKLVNQEYIIPTKKNALIAGEERAWRRTALLIRGCKTV